MDAVNPREVQQCFVALAAAQAKFEEHPSDGSGNFRGVLHAVRREIAAWAEAGLYLGSDVQRLRSECAAREALIQQLRQQRDRGY